LFYLIIVKQMPRYFITTKTAEMVLDLRGNSMVDSWQTPLSRPGGDSCLQIRRYSLFPRGSHPVRSQERRERENYRAVADRLRFTRIPENTKVTPISPTHPCYRYPDQCSIAVHSEPAFSTQEYRLPSEKYPYSLNLNASVLKKENTH